MENKTINKGDKVRVISDSAWKGKIGTVYAVIPNGYYKVAGLELFCVAFDASELEVVPRLP